MRENKIKIVRRQDGVTEAKVVPCKIGDLAEFYGWSYKTIKKKIVAMEREIGKISGHYLNVRQVTIVLRELGIPSTIEVE